jgi:hypothetical protein
MNKTAIKVIAFALAGIFVLCLVGAYVLFFVYPAWMNDRFETAERADFQGGRDFRIRQLLIGKINHGEQFVKPFDPQQLGQPEHDFSRLATTYYHRRGPVGRVLEMTNWFPGPENTYWADARMPASLVAQCAVTGGLPLTPLVGVWSEPPIGRVMLAEGGIASYARPYQWLDFYERNPEIVKLSLPTEKTRPLFSFIEDAQARGANVRVLEGPERKTLADKGPGGFYKVLIVDLLHGGTSFLTTSLVSEDLMTKEAMALYFEALTEDGILLLHTSNRSYDLPPVLGDVAKSLDFASALVNDRGTGFGPGAAPPIKGHFTSEWVVVARKPEYLAAVKAHVVAAKVNHEINWTPLRPTTAWREPWTDGAANSFWEIRR